MMFIVYLYQNIVSKIHCQNRLVKTFETLVKIFIRSRKLW